MSRSSRSIELLGGIAFLLVGLFVSTASPRSGILASLGALILGILVLRYSREFLVLLIAAVPYALGAYLGALSGIRFYPSPPLANYWEASRDQLTALLVCAGIGVAIGVARGIHLAACSAIERFRHLKLHRGALTAVQTIALTAGLWDLFHVSMNYTLILSSNRHVINDSLVIGAGTLGIVLVLTISGMLSIDALVSKVRPKLSLALLLLMWAPSLASGTRAYASMAAATALLIFIIAAQSKIARTAAITGAGVAVAGFTALPSLWSDNELIGYNEWILPNSLYIPQREGVFSVDATNITPLLEQWPLLLPSSLRPYPVHPITDFFTELGVTNVSVGGNPWAETYLSGTWQSALFFSGTTLVILAVTLMVSRASPLTLLVVFGLMMFWGRSTFWGTLVLIPLIALLAYLFTRRSLLEHDPTERLTYTSRYAQ